MPTKVKDVNLKIVDELPTKEPIRKGQLFFISSNDVSYLTHGFHKYPAKFIPHIPRWAIRKYLNGRNKIVLDPFCGSGTTLVECLIGEQNGIGVDIDPLACLISKVKTTKIPKNKLVKSLALLKKKIENAKEGKFEPGIENLYHWFSYKAVRDLSIIRDAIEEFRNESDIYDFFIITFSSIIRRASNADNQSQKTYVSHTCPKKPELAIPLFFKYLDSYSERLITLQESIDGSNSIQIFAPKDSRNLSSYWIKQKLPKADLAVTSPPYIKAIDYIYNQMVELFWVGDIFGLENQKKQNAYKTKYIGTKQIPASEYKVMLETKIPEIDQYVQKVRSRNVKHGYITAKFFIDMEINFREVFKILKKKAHYIVVIGNNSVSGIYIPSHELLMKYAKKVGFKIHNFFGYEIRNRFMRFPRNGRGGIIKEDWIIDLQKE